MLNIGEVVSYWDMCKEEGASLQRGMNFKLHKTKNVILMSVRKNAPYADRIEENGKVLIYEGHDVPRKQAEIPKSVDQEMKILTGKLTQNGLFFEAAKNFKNGIKSAELVKVYEKIRASVWTYNGIFKLTDAWIEESKGRKVFKFRLEITDLGENDKSELKIEHNRLIPSVVKVAVWKRDKGQCVMCKSKENLHFDHIIPFSKGGSSINPENIQLLCAKHNIRKSNKIE